MNEYNKITALYSRLSVGDEDRDGGESNSIVNQKAFLERYAQQQRLTNIRHYIDDDESGRFFDRSAYSRMMEDVENGKIGVCIMKDLTRWGRDYLQVGNAMEVFRRNNVRFIAVNNGIDSDNPDTLEFAPFINIMSEWYAKDISKKVKTGIRTKGASGKPIATEAPYGYMKDPNNKDFWIIDEEAAEVVRLIFRLFIGGKNRNQIAVYLKNEQILTPTFYLKQHDRGTAKSRPLNEENRYKWNKATLTKILTRQEYCGDVVNFKTTKHFRDKRNHYVDKSEWQITENVHEPIIDRADFETVQRILENAPVRRPNGDGEIHPLSGLMFCKDCGAKMHIRIDYRNGGKRHVAFCSEYHKGKAKNPKCNSPHIIDADLVMQTIADVLKKVAESRFWNGAFRRRIPPRSTRWCGLQRSRRNSLLLCCGSPQPPPRPRLRCLPWVQLLRRRSMQMKIKKLGALLVSAALCAGMAAPAFAFEGEAAPVEQPVLPEVVEEDVVTVTDETSGALTPEGNLTLVDDYHTSYSDGSGQQFITLVSKSGATFYLVIDRNAKGQQTVHFMNLVDEADLLALMEEDAADAYTAEKEAAAQAEQDRLKAEEEAKKAAEEAAASGEEQPKENKVTKIASGFLGVVVLIALAAGGGFYAFAKRKRKKQAEKEALDPDANYTEDKGDFEIPTEDEPEEAGEEDTAEE